ncbi:cAMP-binding domain of CRP or a regulatory subunit of cAMP-dependent protein kinases [Chryseobacterium arachidis]|uniref:cAMP-binding domain of CRP or a regulatory subunit of cAMP-dependent protein kinases n=1 Tax=Chryseobacterium arachidis TaxID=1416778 RepID=A0A1M5C0L5_9FLAO|nr:Crp/Fnr family transcriptional regulator [Chryseobacterium arachidis]SHF48293.1 cAMP-binding domain of CRP or a regulatory subunit of cAMP-dependent protein kinases [Chryseobacterium arachidis]
MYTQLEKYLTSRTEIDNKTLSYIYPHFKFKKNKRNEFLLKEGEICKNFYFVNKGCIRLFNINKEGEEATRYFHFEDSLGTALSSLINERPSFEFMQTIEASELLVINREDFFHLVGTIPQFGFIYRQILESAYIKSQERIYCFQGLDAVEKVRWVLTNQAKLLTRLSNKMVASYLGLTPQTLSRLKSKI